jgi:predicted transcriptional regulator of viral defense system
MTMDTRSLLTTLEGYPLFTVNDLSKILQRPPEHLRTKLHRLERRGIVRRIERGKYTVHEDPLIFASFIAAPSYMSLWTALRFYDLTDQLPLEVMVMVARPRVDIEFMGRRITFTKTKHMFGYRRERYNGHLVFIADPEKAIIDSLLTGKVPVSEVASVIETGGLNFRRMVSYAKRTGSSSLAKRLGYLLEDSGRSARGLEKLIDGNTIPLDAGYPAGGERDGKWKILINRSLG